MTLLIPDKFDKVIIKGLDPSIINDYNTLASLKDLFDAEEIQAASDTATAQVFISRKLESLSEQKKELLATALKGNESNISFPY